MLRVGLTGGIGAGKSTVARELARLGALVIDSDRIAREVVEPGTDGLAALVEKFGVKILTPDGSLDREKLATVAFAADTERAALNAILHPLIAARSSSLISQAPQESVVVQDIPLLVENQLAPLFNLVVVVDAPEPERVRRLIERRGMTEDQAWSRIKSQATTEQRREVCDVWLDNTGSADSLTELVQQLWDHRIAPYAANISTGRAVTLDRYIVAEPDPDWPRQARRLVNRLWALCGQKALRIDHIGSTSIPDFAAKDVIDIQVTVRSTADADAVVPLLAAGGFFDLGIAGDSPKPDPVTGEPVPPGRWEKRLCGSADPARPANIHIRVDGTPGQQFALAFPQWIAANETVRTEYAVVKKDAEVAARLDDDVRTYAIAKEPWFDNAYVRTMLWYREAQQQ